ncbi:MAG: HNH endonuclease [candidate division Zixibacteria bacterium]|nr:HNH endonuclease [candidate division Zixibacteria bacterium]
MERKRKRLSRKRKLAILEKQNLKCKKCGRKITLSAYRLRDWKILLGHYPDKTIPSRARFHHLKPFAQGGSDQETNFVALCGLCHSSAHGYYKSFKN